MASIAKFDTWQDSAGVTRSTVLQTVFTQFSTRSALTSIGAGWSSALLSQAITPKIATSKILIKVVMHYNLLAINGAGDKPVYGRIDRNSSTISYGTSGDSGAPAGGSTFGPLVMTYVDTPGVTTTLTYDFRLSGRNDGSNYYTIYVNDSRSGAQYYRDLSPVHSTMVLQEIAQ